MLEKIRHFNDMARIQVDNLPAIKHYSAYQQRRLSRLQEKWELSSTPELTTTLFRNDLKMSIFGIVGIDIVVGGARLIEPLTNAVRDISPERYPSFSLWLLSSVAYLGLGFINLVSSAEIEKKRLLDVAARRGLEVKRPEWFRWPFITKIQDQITPGISE